MQFLSLASLGAKRDFTFLCDAKLGAEVIPPSPGNPSWAYIITEGEDVYSVRRFDTLAEALDSLTSALSHAEACRV